ncbi:tetratricopeptide repeat protein [Aestuariibaculum suncheonense]|uniref:Tetratricopeptide repeat protein n=1 Tax=Aestuariibaculum suncheonense TaxID=1028745 RepID=A0A8J6Q9U7_9FLAO|nr:tetratricopeptide repeat protein [Aestuariibaculum suncheonense]MBD0836843.1 tetratricopeptide repeat protein [Aestuariibaculum suncheonense]
MKNIIVILLSLLVCNVFAQDDDAQKQALLAQKKADTYVYEANNLIQDDDFISAEMAYRKAVSEQPSSVAGIYNLGSSYIKKGNTDEALYRLEQAAKTATSKSEKHKAFHNIGNVLMENKKCKEAVEAYKNALRNDPSDDETRYNLGLAKICAEQQKDQDQQDQNENDQDNKDNQDQQKDKNQENKEDQENKDNKDQGDDKDDQNKDNQDKGDQDKKDGDDKESDDGKPKDEKDQGEGDEKEQPQQPRKGQMSPQQIKNLLEAMNNQEQKVQEKMNAEKVKGVKIKTEKDW